MSSKASVDATQKGADVSKSRQDYLDEMAENHELAKYYIDAVSEIDQNILRPYLQRNMHKADLYGLISLIAAIKKLDSFLSSRGLKLSVANHNRFIPSFPGMKEDGSNFLETFLSPMLRQELESTNELKMEEVLTLISYDHHLQLLPGSSKRLVIVDMATNQVQELPSVPDSASGTDVGLDVKMSVNARKIKNTLVELGDIDLLFNLIIHTPVEEDLSSIAEAISSRSPELTAEIWGRLGLFIAKYAPHGLMENPVFRKFAIKIINSYAKNHRTDGTEDQFEELLTILVFDAQNDRPNRYGLAFFVEFVDSAFGLILQPILKESNNYRLIRALLLALNKVSTINTKSGEIFIVNPISIVRLVSKLLVILPDEAEDFILYIPGSIYKMLVELEYKDVAFRTGLITQRPSVNITQVMDHLWSKFIPRHLALNFMSLELYWKIQADRACRKERVTSQDLINSHIDEYLNSNKKRYLGRFDPPLQSAEVINWANNVMQERPNYTGNYPYFLKPNEYDDFVEIQKQFAVSILAQRWRITSSL